MSGLLTPPSGLRQGDGGPSGGGARSRGAEGSRTRPRPGLRRVAPYLAYDALHRGDDVAGALRAIADEPFDPVLYEGLGEDVGLPARSSARFPSRISSRIGVDAPERFSV